MKLLRSFIILLFFSTITLAENAAVLTVAPTPVASHQIYFSRATAKRPLIVIDAGHGGEDLGALSPEGIHEKDIVLNIALILDVLLRERLRAKTVLTRVDDTFIPLPMRTNIANVNNADLFISIHANASEHRQAKGVETYYLDNTKDKSSLKLAERENSAGAFANGALANDLSFMLGDLIQNVKLEDSISLAHYIENALVNNIKTINPTVNKLGVKKAPFYVLVGVHSPCVLTEVSFIDNAEEGRLLAKEAYQTVVAEGIYQGVLKYFESRNSF